MVTGANGPGALRKRLLIVRVIYAWATGPHSDYAAL